MKSTFLTITFLFASLFGFSQERANVNTSRSNKKALISNVKGSNDTFDSKKLVLVKSKRQLIGEKIVATKDGKTYIYKSAGGIDDIIKLLDSSGKTDQQRASDCLSNYRGFCWRYLKADHEKLIVGEIEDVPFP